MPNPPLRHTFQGTGAGTCTLHLACTCNLLAALRLFATAAVTVHTLTPVLSLSLSLATAKPKICFSDTARTSHNGPRPSQSSLRLQCASSSSSSQSVTQPASCCHCCHCYLYFFPPTSHDGLLPRFPVDKTNPRDRLDRTDRFHPNPPTDDRPVCCSIFGLEELLV